MGQYPSPYQPPQQPGYAGGYGYDPAAQALRPCRRTGVLMIVLGGLLLLMGGCLAGLFWMPGMQEAVAPKAALPPGMSFDRARSEFTVSGIIMVIVAVLLFVLGVFVRRGKTGAIITSIVLTFLIIGWTLLQITGGFVQSASLGMAGQAALGACVLAVPLGLMVWLLIWLFQSNGAARRWVAWQSQYGAPYQQYGQGQPGYPQQQPQTWPQPGWPGQPQPGWPQQPPPPQQQQQQQNWPPPSPPPSHPG